MSAAAKLAVLGGTMIDANPLSLLRANPLVWGRVFAAVEHEYAWHASHVDRASVACKTICMPWWPTTRITFPPPRGLNVNMMPFKLFQPHATLPPELQPYEPFIASCAQLNMHLFHNRNHVAYLSVHESAVPVGSTQRRAGVHVERPGGMMVDGGRIVPLPPIHAINTPDYFNSEYHYLAWGLGAWRDGFTVEGMFMASNVADSCAVWPVLIDRPEEVTDAHGGVPDAMLPYLGPGRRTLAAGELVWLTDRTPHESLPVQAPYDDPGATTVYRQFFRLVVGRISVWYARHNTPNPLGVAPDAPVSHEDKFTDRSV